MSAITGLADLSRRTANPPSQRRAATLVDGCGRNDPLPSPHPSSGGKHQTFFGILCARNFINTSAFCTQMSASLAKQFEDYAARCLEIARHSKTRAGRARFMQMAREYQSAASLIQNEQLSSPEGGPCPPRGPTGAKLLPPRLLDQGDQLSHAYALVRRESWQR